MGAVTAEQVVVIDIDGNQLEGEDVAPSERFIHTEIYRARPDVGGVIHTHQVLATVFGIVNRPILPILHVESPLVARGIPTFPSPELITTQELGRGVAEAMGDHPICHLRSHGIAAAAATLQEATLAVIHLERLARANLLAAQLGTPYVLPPEEIERIAGPMVGWNVRWAYYASLADDDYSGPANW